MFNRYFLTLTILGLFGFKLQIYGQSFEIETTFEKYFTRFAEFINDLDDPNEEDHQQSFESDLLRFETELNRTKVWLTVASAVDVSKANLIRRNFIVRAIEIHWRRPTTPSRNDFIAILRVNDSRQIRRYPLIDPKTNQTLSHYLKTDLEFDYQNLPDLDNGLQEFCLQYFVIYMNDRGETEAINCVRMQSRWMQKLLDLIENRTLSELMIPGTHDASSFTKYNYFDYTFDDESIYNQLAYGIRYLDFRVAVYNQTNRSHPFPWRLYEEFWMVHDIQKNSIKLSEALEQVRKFIVRTTHEIVIVDFHRFVHGFNKIRDLNAIRRRLKQFIRLVYQHLGPYLIPFNETGLPTIGEILRQGKRVLIGYAYKFDDRSLPDSDLFWPPVTHLWANTDRLVELESYIKREICKGDRSYPNGHHLRSVMGELTPKVEGVIFRRYHGLRELAALVNIHYNDWFRYRWWNCSNIVAADFFLGSDLVDISIDVNRRRFQF
ncbi:hypothetical protein SSS_00775 [Sarcoptes scabiei]|uniref:Uncharacterized protein n=1 Tax=Sarcoptes scabiei TaxID=52283 RepID=A0A834VI53_SARSC|nr:hypothetical protein SSS_00775 [Sarcoptes scabiei]